MKRRLFSMMLAIMVLFTSVDVSVFAGEGEESEVVEIFETSEDNKETLMFQKELTIEQNDINGLEEEDCVETLATGNALVDTIVEYAKSKLHSDAWSGYCQAFVKACYEAAGIRASKNASTATQAKGWWRVSNDLSNIPIGACVYWYDNHVAIYLGNDRIIHTVKGVYKEGDSNVSYVEETSLSYYTSKGKIECWGYQAGYDLYSGTEIKPINKFTSSIATNITETTATIEALLDDFYSVSTCGFYFGTSSTNMSKIVENANTTVKKIYYSLGNGSKWIGSLEKGTTYYYQFYATINGVEHKGDICTFTTLGTTYHNPRGDVNHIIGGEGSINIRGWVIDDDVPTESLRIHVYVGGSSGSGAPSYEFYANKHRPDVGAAFPGVGDYHGYEENILTDKTGAVEVYIYGINGGAGGTNVEIGHGTVNVTPDTTAPVITNAYIKQYDKDGYTVVAEVEDNVGLSSVRMAAKR